MNPKHEARKLRSDVYNVNNAMRMPIDVTEIAKKLNISVEMRELPSFVTGFIIKEASEKIPTIYVNAADTVQRRRLTIAHELGYYTQHKDNAELAHINNTYDEASTNTNSAEHWRTTFAAELLMPEALVLKYWAEGWTCEHIQKRLNVSELILVNRLHSLGLI